MSLYGADSLPLVKVTDSAFNDNGHKVNINGILNFIGWKTIRFSRQIYRNLNMGELAYR